MSRSNQVLAGLLAAQILLFSLVYTLGRGDASSRVAPVLLLEGLGRDSVDGIAIAMSDKAALRLERGEKGWVLAEQAGFPADSGKVDKLLTTLLGLQSSHVVSRGAEHYTELEVAEDKYRRKLTVKAGTDERVVFVGKRGGGFTPARLAGADAVLAIDELDEWDLGTRIQDWIAEDYFKVPAERVAAIEIRKGESALRLERAHLSEWQLQAEKVEAAKVRPILDAAVALKAIDVVGKLEDAEARGKVDKAAEPVTVTLELAEYPLEDAVPEPEPLGQSSPDAGMADAGAAAAGGDADGGPVAGDAGPPKPRMPPIVERKVIHLAVEKAGAASDVYGYVEGETHVVELDHWRMQKLLEASADKIRGQDAPP
ncbi:MAG: DUF4340 domain-containing protein [Deltaproteobacteria bacterium]|nr:DUF4340 domain-containing protein [Deltaproteobacteria bacterium]